MARAARKRRVVYIPRPSEQAFNKDRIAGTLLRSQTVHFRHALARHMEKVVRHMQKVAALLATDLNSIQTEGQVSEYVKRATAILHPKIYREPRG